MSLHIELTDEAKSKWQRNRKKTAAAAIVASTLSMTLLLLVFYMITIIIGLPEDPKIITYHTPQSEDPDPTPPSLPAVSTPLANSPNAHNFRTVISTAASISFAANPEVVSALPNEKILTGGIEISVGVGYSVASGWQRLLPDDMIQRCSKEDRLKRIQDNGGVPETEVAVIRSLDWLKGQQQGDGSWQHNSSNTYRVAMTGLTILTYLAHCETPMSDNYGEQVLKGIIYLVNIAMKNPYCSTTPASKEICYEHAIATYALCEAYTFCQDMGIPALENLDKAAIKCIEKIIDAQQPNGGWGYNYDGNHVDLSVTGWNIQALKAAYYSGLRLSSKKDTRLSLRKAGKYVKSCSAEDGRFRYSPEDTTRVSLQGVGLLSLQMTNDGNDPIAHRGYEWVKNNVTTYNYENGAKMGEDGNFDRGDLYMHYYLVQAMINRGSEYWQQYNKTFVKDLYKQQAANGKFKTPPYLFTGGTGNIISSIYLQCLATLSMEAYYRFLPGTGRDH